MRGEIAHEVPSLPLETGLARCSPRKWQIRLWNLLCYSGCENAELDDTRRFLEVVGDVLIVSSALYRFVWLSLLVLLIGGVSEIYFLTKLEVVKPGNKP